MYSVPDLPYAYDALEPVISKEIMELHHDKHHKTYVDKLNAALERAPQLRETSLVELLSDINALPEEVRAAIRNHGGGHYNHSLFWLCMKPDASPLTAGRLYDAIIAKWGSVDDFQEAFNEKALGLFGSGWVWLTADLELLALPNQDAPMDLGKGEPLMGLDIWEHAYYLDYRNRRDEYIKNWWQVVDWSFIEARYENLYS
ncbi:MAG: superoxide dismutase [Candidatus Saccharimonas sp.]